MDFSRRGFLQGTIGVGAATAVGRSRAAHAEDEVVEAVEAPTPDTPRGELSEVMVSITVNGQNHALPVKPLETAAHVLRERLDLTGTKIACGQGACGACTVRVDGAPACACLLPATALHGREVETIEGVAGEELHPVQKAFVAHDAMQCGFCTPGFVVESVAFYDGWKAAGRTGRPERDEIAAALAGHLCRCGAYQGIYAAVAAACAGDFDPSGRRRRRRRPSRRPKKRWSKRSRPTSWTSWASTRRPPRDRRWCSPSRCRSQSPSGPARTRSRR